MQPIIEQLAQTIRDLYEKDPESAPEAIEEYLGRQLHGLDLTARKHIISRLEKQFPPPEEPANEPESVLRQDYLLHFCSLVLGKNLTTADLSSSATLERLTHSLNTIFDSLNQLVHSIRITLFTENTGEETIRHVVGSSLTDDEASVSLEHYLGEIRSAFFMSHQAFTQAAKNTIEKILDDLDPDKMGPAGKGGFMLGTLRKKQSFDHYAEVFKNFRQWHESGRSADIFLQEFEKECRRLSQQSRR